MRGRAGIDLDRIAFLLEEIDHGRHEQPEVRRRDVRQRRPRTVEEQQDLDPSRRRADGCLQPVEAQVVEPIRHQEIFADQPVALEGGAQARQQSLRPVDADEGGGRHPLEIRRAAGRRPPTGAVDRVEQRGRARTARETEVEPVERQLGERARPCAREGEADGRLGAPRHRLGEPRGLQGAAVGQVSRRLEGHRPEGHVLRGRVGGARGQPLAEGRDEAGAAPHRVAVRHPQHLRPRVKGGERHGRRRPGEIGPEPVEQVAHAALRLGVELEPGPCREPGHPFEQPFHIGGPGRAPYRARGCAPPSDAGCRTRPPPRAARRALPRNRRGRRGPSRLLERGRGAAGIEVEHG